VANPHEHKHKHKPKQKPHEPNGEPNRRTHELVNPDNEPSGEPKQQNPGAQAANPQTQVANPRTQGSIEPANVYDSLRQRSFSLYSLFFICAEQEHKSLILEFHWKSSPTHSSSAGNRLLQTRFATVNSSLLNSRCYFH